MDERYRKLLDLQELDRQVEEAESKLKELDAQLVELDAPADARRRETEAVRSQLAEMRGDVERLERVEADKAQRLKRYEERLGQARSQRDQAALRAEIDLVRRAIEADRQDRERLRDQIRRTELKLDEMDRDLAKAEQDGRPEREALVQARKEAEDNLAIIVDRRENHALRLEKPALRLYERVRAGRTRAVLAPLTQDGACGHCFNVIPMQERAEIRGATGFARCEACGVILYAED